MIDKINLAVVDCLGPTRIAWVECGNFTDAATLKEWFDNK
jgi:hypothetical protein